jgi:hypothetical protein
MPEPTSTTTGTGGYATRAALCKMRLGDQTLEPCFGSHRSTPSSSAMRRSSIARRGGRIDFLGARSLVGRPQYPRDVRWGAA